MASKPKAAPDKREQFLQANQRGFVGVALPPKAIEDLKYFEVAAKKGRAIRTDALLEWIKAEHGIDLGPTRLHRIAREAGITPWWSAR